MQSYHVSKRTDFGGQQQTDSTIPTVCAVSDKPHDNVGVKMFL